MSVLKSAGESPKTSLSDEEKDAVTSQLEDMLLHGRREEALRLAVQKEMYPLALLIGSICGKDEFQYVTRCYADSNLSSASLLHFVSMLYSNQARNALRHGGMQLLKVLPGSSSNSNQTEIGHSAIVRGWSKNLAAIIANKSGEWSDLCKTLGERVIAETNVNK